MGILSAWRSRRTRNVPEGMARIVGGRFTMGSDDHYPEERPAHRASVASFDIDVVPVTNAAFARFVADTGYRTLAERAPDPGDYPDADGALLKAGSSVFVGTAGPVSLDDPLQWWRYRPGAYWSAPEGPGSDITDRMDHPVVHVAFEDARAFAVWSGKRLPTETEWEFAARGGLDRAPYAWGTELAPGGVRMANYWQGAFPWRPKSASGRTSPVGQFPANRYGLHDMIGNVWEWTSDDFGPHADGSRPCCTPAVRAAGARRPADFAAKVLKGGSHLCAQEYCQRYRPSARHPQTVDTSTTHIGFRCAADVVD